MISKLIAAVAPYLVWIALAIGLSLGGGFAWWLQGNRIERRDLRIERLERAIADAAKQAEIKAAQAEADIAIIAAKAAATQAQEVIKYVEVVKEIEVVASPTAQCLSPSTLGVLQRSQNRGDAQGPNPRISPPAVPRPPAAGGGPIGAISERGMANYQAAVTKQYRELQARDNEKSEIIRSLPCVDVVRD